AGMMAGHPNDASPLGLRNVAFALQCGGKDSAYNRNKIIAEWGKKLDVLRGGDPGGYDHFLRIYEDKSHWMDREDAVALPWMAKHRRDPIPDCVVWKQSSVTHDSLYWLAVPAGSAKPDTVVTARRSGQNVEVTAANGVSELVVHFDDRFADLDLPVRVNFDGKVLFDGPARRTMAVLIRTLMARGDQRLMYDAELALKIAGGRRGAPIGDDGGLPSGGSIRFRVTRPQL